MIERVVDLLQRVRATLDRRLTGRAKRIVLGVAVAVFLVGGVLALRALDLDRDGIAWLPLIVAAVIGVPLTALVNAAEYVVTARIVGQPVPLVPALRISVLSTAANMLPIPGAALVRIRALRELGPSYRSATSATVIVGFTWIGVSTASAGGWLAATGASVRGAPFLAVGVVLLAAAWVLLRRAVDEPARRRRLAASVIGVEVVSVASSALRIVLVLAGLGLEPSVVGGLVLSVSGATAAATGIFPAGLGIRELIAAGLAPVAGLSAAAGFAASAVNRVLGIIVHAPITAGLALTVSDGPPTEAEPFEERAGGAADDPTSPASR